MIAALLLGREGSKGFPGKNLHPILGRPMMVYPLLAARAAPEVERVYLSTDSEKMAKIARAHGAEVIDRPPELATDQALGEEAYAHGYREIRKRIGREPELLVLLFCNAPTILPQTISEGIRLLRQRPDADSAVTCSRYNMWSPVRARRIRKDGFLEPFVPLESIPGFSAVTCDRDSQGDVYFADMSCSIVRPRCLQDLSGGVPPQRWMGRSILPLLQEGGLDVDYEWQVGQAEHWLRRHGFTEISTPYDLPVKP